MREFPFPKFRDLFLTVYWIVGLVSVCGMCWFFTRPLRANLLMRTINRAWAYEGKARQLYTPLASGQKLDRLGMWFYQGEGSRVLAFTIISDGIFLPCAAVVNSQGKVEDILPLSANGDKMLSRIPSGMIQLYIRRIEGNNE